MIYIFTAMYCEARMLIEAYGLKKIKQTARFSQSGSKNPDILLTISGVGEIAAAVSVASVCTEHPPAAGDFLVNIGTCGGPPSASGLYVACKLTEEATGKTFYPDMLYRHDLKEAHVITCMRPRSGKEAPCGGKQITERNRRTDREEPEKLPEEAVPDVSKDAAGLSREIRPGGGAQTELTASGLYDMEAAAVWQAGASFFGPHQMIFLKIVSDHGVTDTGPQITGSQIMELMMAHQKECVDFISRLWQISAEAHQCQGNGKPQEEALVRQVCRDMHATKAMEDLIRQQIHYLALAHGDYEEIIRRLYEERLLPCRDKKEGKRCFAEFRKRLF